MEEIKLKILQAFTPGLDVLAELSKIIRIYGDESYYAVFNDLFDNGCFNGVTCKVADLDGSRMYSILEGACLSHKGKIILHGMSGRL